MLSNGSELYCAAWYGMVRYGMVGYGTGPTFGEWDLGSEVVIYVRELGSLFRSWNFGPGDGKRVRKLIYRCSTVVPVWHLHRFHWSHPL